MYIMYKYIIANEIWGHGGSVVTHSPSTSEITVRIPAWPHVGNYIRLQFVGSSPNWILTNCMYWFPLPFQQPSTL